MNAACSSEEGGMGVPALKRAYEALEAGFTELVSRSFEEQPRLACVGTCSLVGMVAGEGDQLIIGNLGDTRAVLGTSTATLRKSDSRKGLMRSHADDDAVSAVQLSTDHNVNIAEERRQMQARFPEDSEVVVDTRGSYRVKGRIQVGIAYQLYHHQESRSVSLVFFAPSMIHEVCLCYV